MKDSSLLVYTFGYWGWGTHTKELVAAMDSAAASAGFRPPIFVDIRFSRTVRATGFQGNAFGNLVSAKRHHWINQLGNRNIGTDRPGIEIADPSAVSKLLDLAIEAATRKRRLVVFCACEITSICHRHTVAELLKKEGKKRKTALSITEWPGGKPQQIELFIPPELFQQVERGRKSVPLVKPYGNLRALPWHSVIKLRNIDDPDQSFLIITGPAKYANGPYLPVLNGTLFGYPQWR